MITDKPVPMRKEFSPEAQDLIANLLPPEGDFLVILIDALGGNDQIIVGPTVQKTVWVDAGDGTDYVCQRVHSKSADVRSL